MSAASSSQKIENFFTSTFDSVAAAMEATWTYHIINGNQSFKSADCATKIFRTCFKMKKFSCSKTKCQAIVLNVPISMRWVEIFTHLETENCDYKEMATIVEYILCLPGSTASVKRVFACMNKTWTADKSQL